MTTPTELKRLISSHVERIRRLQKDGGPHAREDIDFLREEIARFKKALNKGELDQCRTKSN